jgi:formamidopyrimidine-DNA glycosylase
MPEGPECRITATQLNARYVGLTLVNIEWDNTSAHFFDNSVGYYRFAEQLPAKLMRVYTHAKKIIFEFLTCKDQKPMHLISFMAMTGTWKSARSDKYKYIRYVLNFGHLEPADNMTVIEKSVYYDDKMAMGRMDVSLCLADYQRILKNIGHDLLEISCNNGKLVNGDHAIDLWVTTLQQPKLANTTICEFLLDQKYFSGIGNYLRAEILYYAQINPYRPPPSLTLDESVKLFNMALFIINKSFNEGGHTSSDFFDLDGAPGQFACVVYEQKSDPNGYPILRETIDKRSIFYCPSVQK